MPVFSDAALRCSDIITLAAVSGNAGKFIAIRLIDGGWDGTVYDHFSDAVRHQLHHTLCTYVKVPPDGMPPGDASELLDYWRKAYDAGFRQPDPEIRTPLMPLLKADRQRQIDALTKRGK